MRLAACGRASLPDICPSSIPATPRFRSGFLFSWEAGRVVRASLFYFKARPPRPADAFAPDGWAGLVRKVFCRIRAGQNLRPYRPDLHRGPDLWWVGSHQATLPLRDRPGHRHPPRMPGAHPGSRKGDGWIIGYGARRGINCDPEKCESELNQGVGGKGGPGTSTLGDPLSGVFQALARAASHMQENAFSPAKGRDRGGTAGPTNL